MRTFVLNDGAGNIVNLDTMPGSYRILRDLAGWYGGAKARTDRTDRLGDGTFPSRVHRNGRELTIDALVQLANRDEAEAYERKLSGLFPDGSTGTVQVAGVGPTLTAYDVELDGEPKVVADLPRGVIKWQLPLFVPDPYLYGDAQTTMAYADASGTGLKFPLFTDGHGKHTGYATYGASRPAASTLVNGGNAIAYPTVLVTGEFRSGFVLRLSGDGTASGVWGVTYRGDVRTQSPVLVDFAGSASVAGVDQSWALTERGWGGVRPGGNVTVSITPVAGGSGSARLSLRSTYL